jgi:hypothetical protein
MITVKHGDKYPIEFVANMDLTDASVRLLAKKVGTTTVLALDASVTDGPGGVITHNLDGTLITGQYDIEAEATIGNEIITFPNDGYERLVVTTDLG